MTKTASRIALKKVKTFMGREGVGLNCDIHFDGKKVCSVIDSANGGPISYYFPDRATEQTVLAYVAAQPVTLEVTDYPGGTPSENTKMTDLVCPICGSKLMKSNYSASYTCLTCDKMVMSQGNDLDSLINMILTQMEAEKIEKKMRKQCETKTLTRSKGQKKGTYSIWSIPFSEKSKATILATDPNVIEFINEGFAK